MFFFVILLLFCCIFAKEIYNVIRLEAVANFRKRKFSVTTEFLAKDRRELTTDFAIAFKPMLGDAFLRVLNRFSTIK